MGSGPVKGFNSEEVQQIVTRKHDPGQNKIAKEDGQTATFAAGDWSHSAGECCHVSRVPTSAGCFWGVQLSFQRVPGVVSSMVGYTAGSKLHPTYNEVCSGQTGDLLLSCPGHVTVTL